MNPAAVHIAPASLRDLRALRALEVACFGPDAWGYFELFTLFATFGAVRLKALIPLSPVPGGKGGAGGEGRLVGFAAGEMHPPEGVGWISTIGVHPDFQRQGIGGRLLAECEARLSARRLRLTVRASNARAIALYRQFGYAEIRRTGGYYAGGEDGIVMEKTQPE